MKKRYRNAFFIIGAIALIIMATRLNFIEVKEGIERAGYWFVVAVVLWLFLYMLNTASWYIIINSQKKSNNTEKSNVSSPKETEKITFLWLYKVTVSGFALNYVTPCGVMGSEPYRIMALAPRIGMERASASVLLFSMTHIYSHFWLWALSVLLFITTQRITPSIALVLVLVSVFCIIVIRLFMKGYRKGFTLVCIQLFGRFRIARKWTSNFIEKHKTQLYEIDQRIAELHNHNPRTFISVVFLELGCRILSALEIYFILLVINPDINYPQCVLIQAFTSLFANIFFFIPLQLGGREGGFLLSAKGVALTINDGIFVSLLVRIRELIWTAIGLLLINFDKQKTFKK